MYDSMTGPKIAIGLGIGGMWGAMCLSIFGTVKATKKIREIEWEQEVELDRKQKFKVAAPYFIAPALLAAASTGAIIWGTKSNLTQLGVALATGKMVEKELEATKKAEEDVVGEKKAGEIKKRATQLLTEMSDTKNRLDIIETGNGTMVMCDPYFLGGRLFMGDIQTVRSRYNDIGQKMATDINEMVQTSRDVMLYAYGIDIADELVDKEYLGVMELTGFDITSNGAPKIDIDVTGDRDSLGRPIHYIIHDNKPIILR